MNQYEFSRVAAIVANKNFKTYQERMNFAKACDAAILENPNNPFAVLEERYKPLFNSENLNRAMTRFEQKRVIAENLLRHLPGKHDQSTHGHGGGSARAGMGDIGLDENTVAEMAGGSAAPHIIVKSDGSYAFTPERQKLHDEIVKEALAGVPSSANPTYVVLGGGAASGKSTAVSSSGIKISERHVVVNPDDVKAKLPEYKTTNPINAAKFTHEESSYLGKRIQAAAFERKTDVVADGVGNTSEASMTKKISAAKKAGYRVTGAYVTVPTEIALQRAQARAQKSGRHVPEWALRNGHKGVSNTFPKIVDQFDEVSLFDNSGTSLKLIGSGKNGMFEVQDRGLWNEFLAKGGE